MIYIGAEEIISPLGKSAEENFSAILANRSGISLADHAGFNGDSVYISKILDLSEENKFENLITTVLNQVIIKIDNKIVSSERTVVLLSSTKGDLDNNINDQFGKTIATLTTQFNLANQPIVVSNACISGVLAINTAGNFIESGLYDHVIVIGCDLISNFVLFGFQSLFAISNQPCTPFDASRNGITMGEGCGALVISNSKMIFKEQPLKLLSGTSANDANHISGPSRTGEGLYRSVKRTMEMNDLLPADIDFISAHGTGTIYNDEMESIAFDRSNLTPIPLNSFKGYFGHTLGAAGVIETAISMQMLRNQMLIKSPGFETTGTSKELNIVKENKPANLRTILKTASGFGGGNASLLIQKI